MVNICIDVFCGVRRAHFPTRYPPVENYRGQNVYHRDVQTFPLGLASFQLNNNDSF